MSNTIEPTGLLSKVADLGTLRKLSKHRTLYLRDVNDTLVDIALDLVEDFDPTNPVDRIVAARLILGKDDASGVLYEAVREAARVQTDPTDDDPDLIVVDDDEDEDDEPTIDPVIGRFGCGVACCG